MITASAGRTTDFNPRSPHGERLDDSASAFCSLWHFNPRSPHGERHNSITDKETLLEFQPTLPARGATETMGILGAMHGFQPTLPARGATRGRVRALPHFRISTHAPRTGSDGTARLTLRLQPGNFNPRSPHGERRRHRRGRATDSQFQPTLPARGATAAEAATVRPY